MMYLEHQSLAKASKRSKTKRIHPCPMNSFRIIFATGGVQEPVYISRPRAWTHRKTSTFKVPVVMLGLKLAQPPGRQKWRSMPSLSPGSALDLGLPEGYASANFLTTLKVHIFAGATLAAGLLTNPWTPSCAERQPPRNCVLQGATEN